MVKFVIIERSRRVQERGGLSSSGQRTENDFKKPLMNVSERRKQRAINRQMNGTERERERGGGESESDRETIEREGYRDKEIKGE